MPYPATVSVVARLTTASPADWILIRAVAITLNVEVSNEACNYCEREHTEQNCARRGSGWPLHSHGEGDPDEQLEGDNNHRGWIGETGWLSSRSSATYVSAG